jgi:hypothetical protein
MRRRGSGGSHAGRDANHLGSATNNFEGHCTSADGGMQFEGAGSSLPFKSVDRTDGKGNPGLAFQQDGSSGQSNDRLRVNDLQSR